MPVTNTIANEVRSTSFSPVASAGPFALDFPLYEAASLTALKNDLVVTLDGVETSAYTVTTANYTNGVALDGAITLTTAYTGTVVVRSLRAPRSTSSFSAGQPTTAAQWTTLFNSVLASVRDGFDLVDEHETRLDQVENATEPFASNYADRAALAAASVLVSVIRVYVKSYDATVSANGGAWYKRVNAEPAHSLKVQDAAGAWWEIDEPEIYAEQAGAIGDGTTDDAPAIQKAIDALEARFDGSGTVMHQSVSYKIGTQLRIKTGINLQGTGAIFGAYGTSAGLPPNTGTKYLCNTALNPAVLIQAAVWGDYVHGGGIVGILFDGDNVGVTGIEARTINGTRFDIWGEQFTDRLLKINNANGNITINPRIEASIYRSGANAACINSGNVLLHTTTVGYHGFIWGTVQNGVNLDIYVTDASSFAHVQGGLQDKDVHTGKNIIFRGAKYSTGQAITGHANNGSGAPRFTAAAHGLWTGKSIALGGWVTAVGYNTSNVAVTVIDANTFDVTSLAYVAEAPSASTKFSTLTHAARRNKIEFAGGYADIVTEFSDAKGASQPANFATINGEGLTNVSFETSPAGGSGVLDYKVVDWPTGEIVQTRRWPMRASLDFPIGEATLGSNVTRAVFAGGNMPGLQYSATNSTATNYATWGKSPQHWGNGTITRVRIRYTSATDPTNAFSLAIRVTPFATNETPGGGTLGTLHTLAAPVSTVANLNNEVLLTVSETYTKGDNILLSVASNGDTDTATVGFVLYSVDIEYESEGPPDHAPGVLNQVWGVSLDSAPQVT